MAHKSRTPSIHYFHCLISFQSKRIMKPSYHSQDTTSWTSICSIGAFVTNRQILLMTTDPKSNTRKAMEWSLPLRDQIANKYINMAVSFFYCSHFLLTTVQVFDTSMEKWHIQIIYPLCEAKAAVILDEEKLVKKAESHVIIRLLRFFFLLFFLRCKSKYKAQKSNTAATV